MRSLSIITLCITIALSCSFDTDGQTRRRRVPARHPPAKTDAAPRPAAANASAPATTTGSGLTYLITRQGKGRQPKAGEMVVVHYTGALSNGLKFDSSRDRNDPFAFKLGAGHVIKGWDEGVAQLHIGDQAVLIIPPQLGYGSKGAGNGLIPPEATLVFIIEVVDVKATSLSELLAQTFEEKGIEAAVAQYQELKKGSLADVYTSESDMNALGYRLLASGHVKEAIEILKLNVEAYPTSANVYDSLAEAYRASGDKQAAIENYKKALAINPQMESARKALQALNAN